MTERTPECEIVREKASEAFSSLDSAMMRIYESLKGLDKAERFDIRQLVAMHLARRLMEVMLGGLTSREQMDASAVSLVTELGMLAQAAAQDEKPSGYPLRVN